jgi:hypothetical protein
MTSKKAVKAAKGNPFAHLEAGKTYEVPISGIIRDWRFQPRVAMDAGKVTEYRSQVAAGAEFPPVLVGRIGEAAVMLDGWHRAEAHILAGRTTIRAVMVDTTERGGSGWRRRPTCSTVCR